MSYTKVTNFAVKDGLPTGNPSKIVKGTEIDVEFNAIQAATAALSTAVGITNTPAGTIAATTVQAAINELDTEKAALSGATFTGQIIASVGNMLIGSATDDGVNKLQVTGNAKVTGNIVKGVDTPVTVNSILPSTQIWGVNTANNASEVLGISGANVAGPIKYFVKTRGTNPGDLVAVVAGDLLGGLQWQVDDGVDYSNSAAMIRAYAEATATSNNAPAYLAFYTNYGAQLSVENFRITGSGAQLFKQSAPAAKTTVVTLTTAEIMAGLITGTPSAGNTAYTLPLGTDVEAGILGLAYINQSFDWSLINLATGTNTITLTGNTGHTIIGNPLLAISSSSMWRTRRTAANTFVTYRIA